MNSDVNSLLDAENAPIVILDGSDGTAIGYDFHHGIPINAAPSAFDRVLPALTDRIDALTGPAFVAELPSSVTFTTADPAVIVVERSGGPEAAPDGMNDASGIDSAYVSVSEGRGAAEIIVGLPSDGGEPDRDTLRGAVGRELVRAVFDTNGFARILRDHIPEQNLKAVDDEVVALVGRVLFEDGVDEFDLPTAYAAEGVVRGEPGSQQTLVNTVLRGMNLPEVEIDSDQIPLRVPYFSPMSFSET